MFSLNIILEPCNKIVSKIPAVGIIPLDLQKSEEIGCPCMKLYMLFIRHELCLDMFGKELLNAY